MPVHNPSRRALVRTLAALVGGLAVGTPIGALGAAPARPLRILHVMSFDSPWRWTDGQFAGFKEAFDGIPVEYRVFQMDVKRHGSPGAKAAKGREARAIIESWKPDLVYASDDDAQAFVTRHYVGTTLPFVFSGVNKDPREHGIADAPNVTGVLEHEHFAESVRLLQALVPSIRRIAVLSDSAPHWTPVIERIRGAMPALRDVTLAAVDQVKTFEEYRARVNGYPQQADAVVYLGIFALAGPDGSNVPYQQVQRWTAEHSRLPDASFWIDRVHHGVLASVTVSELAQGRAAGALARAVLVEGRSPRSLPVRPTLKGHPAINLARARQLGISVKSSLLLSAEVVKSFEWERSGA